MNVTNSLPSTVVVPPHVAVWSWPFTSHPVVLFHLIHRLATAASQVQFSIFSTTKSNNYISSTQTSNNLPTNIKFYDVEDGLTVGIDNGDEAICFMKQVPENFKRAMAAVVAESGRFTCLITDAIFSSFVAKIAEEMSLPWIAFWPPAPQDLAVYLQTDLIQQLYANARSENHDNPEDQIIDIIPGLPPVCFKDLPFFERLVGDSKNRLPFLVPQAFAVVVNSYEELNPPLLSNYLKSKFQNLFFISSSTRWVTRTSDDAEECLSWLDTKEPASVAYISFGTTVDVGCEELVALAEAIEAFGVPFLWSLKDNLKNCLPNGFLERCGSSGKVVSWSPQRQVLEHPSIGVFVTHCGYNSVLESIWGGVPLICRSVWVDNHITALMVEEVWGIGVGVAGRVITKAGMIKSLEIIFQQEKGKKIRQAIGALKEVLIQAAGPDGVAAKHFNNLLQIIISQEYTK